MADSKSLADLHPVVRAIAQRLLYQADAAGIPLTMLVTLRSMSTQAALYAQGRTVPGRIVTNAAPGYSFHNYGLALDVAPTELLALPEWGDAPATRAHVDALWGKVGAIGTGLGFRWGGAFAHLVDRPHFEWSGGLTLAQLRAGLRPSAPVDPTRNPPSPVQQRRSEDMKINLAKLVGLLGRIVVAAPAIVAAAKPVIDAVKNTRKAS